MVDHVESLLELLNLVLVEHGEDIAGRPLQESMSFLCQCPCPCLFPNPCKVHVLTWALFLVVPRRPAVFREDILVC